jgi:hypothetical protein
MTALAPAGNSRVLQPDGGVPNRLEGWLLPGFPAGAARRKVQAFETSTPESHAVNPAHVAGWLRRRGLRGDLTGCRSRAARRAQVERT